MLQLDETLITFNQLILTLTTNGVQFIALTLHLAPPTDHDVGSGAPMEGPHSLVPQNDCLGVLKLGEEWIILSSFWSSLVFQMAYVHMLN